MFEWLFKYPQNVWREASLVFDTSWPLWILAVVWIVVVLILAATLWNRTISRSRRFIVWSLQSVSVAIVLLMLWQPALLVAVTERGENTVAWVIDNSSSMQREDVDASSNNSRSLSRFNAALEAVETHAFDNASTFDTSLYTIGDGVDSVESLDALAPSTMSSRSDLTGGISSLLGLVKDRALAAVVLVSDGADNANTVDPDWWHTLAAAGIPVHTVGIGQSRNPNDLELVDVTVPEFAQPDSMVEARIRIRHSQATQVRVRIVAGKELLAAQDVELPDNAEESIHSVLFPAGQSGVRQLEISVDPVVDTQGSGFVEDAVPENNRQPRIIQIADNPKRILYIEGEPRWEFKFIRRALDTDSSVELVTLLRTSPNKFYRQGVRSANELAQGFPRTREELYQYDAVIIGSYDAAELSTEQQTFLRDFVSVRGGTLLMLGGRRGLADGGWGRSVTAAALPVILNNRLNSNTFSRTRWQVMPTLAGFRTPWLQLSDDPASVVENWESLPAMADAQDVGQVKPGSVTLLERTPARGQTRQTEALFVMHRYGKGRSAVLGTGGTWRWQMSLPSEDERHERFWRQMLRALVDTTVPSLTVKLDAPVSRDAPSAKVSVVAYNPDFSPVEDSLYPVRVSDPDGRGSTVQLYADPEKPGRFVGEVPVDNSGAFSISALPGINGESPVTKPEPVQKWWVVESGNAELYNYSLNENLLKRIASVSGGTYLALNDIDQLESVLLQENAALKRENRLPLWNMPFLFLCLILLKAVEWMLRLAWKRL